MKGGCVLLVLLSVPFCLSSILSSNDFIKGASTRQQPVDFQTLQYIGANYVRIYVMWGYVQPELKELDSGLNVASLRELYSRNISTLDQYIDSLNWKAMDTIVDTLATYKLKGIMEVGEGTTDCLPHYNGDRADPNVIGEELYLAYQYRFCRAAVRRYKDRVDTYQTENELNEAWLEGLGGQRYKKYISSSWGDWDFLTELLKTLQMSVKDEQPTAATTMNFHTDISQTFHNVLFLKGFYLDAIAEWQSYMDFISFDAYPNMFISEPILGSIVGERLKSIKSIPGMSKKVLVMETGYPVESNSSSLPTPFNFTESHQSEYVEQVFKSVVANGGDGFIYFLVTSQPGITPPPGGYNQVDIETMQMLGKLYLDSDALALLEWLAEDATKEEIETRLPDILSGVMQGWGVLRMDGSARPAVETMKRMFASVS